MFVVHARNVNDAWPQLLDLIQREGVWQETRAGRARVIPVPVSTVYARPTERVLLDPIRDSNPFFSLFEPLWMLAGRDDAQWLDRFVSDFSRRFAETDGRMHGAYGKRWRDWFPADTGPEDAGPDRIDQLDQCVRLLRENPADRQAVIQMWDPSADLGVPGLKDRPCNQQVLLRCDRTLTDEPNRESVRFLDITVTCRSNDVSWGLITANACQFSTLQEYLAARIGVGVGTYTQMSNNLHLYESAMDKCSRDEAWRVCRFEYPGADRMIDDPESFDAELSTFLRDPTLDCHEMKNQFFCETAQPVWLANEHRKTKKWDLAMCCAKKIGALDWRVAVTKWLERRIAK